VKTRAFFYVIFWVMRIPIRIFNIGN